MERRQTMTWTWMIMAILVGVIIVGAVWDNTRPDDLEVDWWEV